MKNRTKFESHRVSLTEILQRFLFSVYYFRDEGIGKITVFNNERILGVQKKYNCRKTKKEKDMTQEKNATALNVLKSR